MDSKTIPDPGIYSQVPEENYFAWKGVSQSLLKELGKSFLHFNHAWKGGFKKETDSMRIGSAVHSAIWDFDKFRKFAFRLPEGFTKARKKDKEEFEDLASRIGEENIFKSSEYDVIVGIVESALSHPDIKTIVESVQPAHREISFVDIDPKLGANWKLKGRADALIPDLGWVLDLKTASDASPEGFRKAASNLGYFLQAAHYVDGFASMGAKSFKWIAIENAPPYAVGLYELTPDHFELGKRYRRHLLDKLARGIEKRLLGEHYTRGFSSLALPTWATNELEFQIEQGIE